ncbi:aspartate/glutamate racemase family protein [Shinella daejeonensis]|uniref:aspartate/glutamate racemase family protein n=1 Tax=Shinella daejeonensis TaxID=659017 RepID=UPI0020C81C28|nr:aspartate/glutamate racemase family protein [Shinella daejeonensis]MCP8893735.1 aspartate/glutamate racemase family protein [Shinella daejeonensis]
MKTIGLIGGMSFESTTIYYQMINEAVRERLGGLHSAEILIHSVNFESIVALQKAGRWDAAGARLAGVAAGLETAGADCILICTNTMHLVSEAVQAAVKGPVIHIVDETARALKAAGRQRPLLLATRYTMEHGFYTERMKAHGLDVMVPDADGRTLMHDVIFGELCQGKVHDLSRDRVMKVIETARAQGADSVILGCTEICLLLDPDALPLPGFDSTAIHAAAAVDFALADIAQHRAA